MSAIPYMPLYISDYLADAAHLSTTEHGAYMLLIMTYWQRGQALPADSKRLANIARMTPDAWAEIEIAIAEFFQIEDGQWKHKRIETELARFREKSEKASAAGKASAQRRTNGRSTDAGRALNYPDPRSEVIRQLPSEQDAARESAEVKKGFLGLGAGRGGEPSPKARRKVAAKLAISDADPLVALYAAWPRSKAARDPDGLFISTAPRLFRDASPEVRKACKPLADEPVPIETKPIPRASSSLVASLARLQ